MSFDEHAELLSISLLSKVKVILCQILLGQKICAKLHCISGVFMLFLCLLSEELESRRLTAS